jgi:hypothetical protein
VTASAPFPVAGPGARPTATDRTLVSEGEAVLPLSSTRPLRRYAGSRVGARRAVVQLVAADEGFWVGRGGRDRVWVRLTGVAESGFDVRAGQRVSFVGRMLPDPRRFARQAGSPPGRVPRCSPGRGTEVPASRVRLSR